MIEWPEIPYAPWRDTCSALHLYTQIVGKYRLARTPWINHSWQRALYVNRAASPPLVPDGSGAIELAFDLIDHKSSRLSLRRAHGAARASRRGPSRDSTLGFAR